MVQGTIGRRTLLGASAFLAGGTLAHRARAAEPIRLGVLSDMSGPYSANAGLGSVLGARLAIEDFKRDNPDMDVDLIQGDFQNKADVGSALARDWADTKGVTAFVDVVASSVAFAVADLVTAKNKVALFTGPATGDLTTTHCGPNHVHWVYDTYSLANSTGRALVAQGQDSWFFITADYAFGHSLESDTAAVVKQAGGKVVGSAATPFPATTDFSSFLLQAQSSGAKVVGLANAGGDTVNCIKQAAEFGLQQQLAGLLIQIADVHAIGLQQAKGLVLTEAFYWDQNDGTRAFSARFAPQLKGQKPSMIHAGAYSSVLHYLRAVKAVGSAQDGRRVVAQMKATPTDDPLFGKGLVRADGRVIHDMFLYQVKTPAESKAPWDYYTLRQTIPAAEAFRPMDPAACKMLHA
ncbi:ABC transporter substrate-binding protein [Acidisphaera sp. L21]|uniref:ABC transporter substrate-binding protein n=1 Tax=Acidisphaera sp. L21 TaxID=1641851 RepID=UPI00131E0C03|nr:ABC transporter substrate-binding protein [Acidisphaera sp. L21]